jgi:transposase
MPKSKPQYPAEFRQQIIELARVGRTPAQLSRELGPTAQSIANWIAQDGRDRGTPLPGKEGLNTAEREELVRLRRGHSNVKQLPFSKFNLGVLPRAVKISWQLAGDFRSVPTAPGAILKDAAYACSAVHPHSSHPVKLPIRRLAHLVVD